MPKREQLASTPEPPLSKGTERFVQSTRSLGERQPHLGARGGIRAGTWEGKSGFHSEGRESWKSLPRTSEKSVSR